MFRTMIGNQVKSTDVFHRTGVRIQKMIQIASNEDASMAGQLLRFAGGGAKRVELATNLAEYLHPTTGSI